MEVTHSEELWLHEHFELSLAELANLTGLTEAELSGWVDEGLLVPLDPGAAPWRFSADRLVTLQRVCRLRRDFELEPQGLALVWQLLERIHSLEAEVSHLQARLPRVLR